MRQVHGCLCGICGKIKYRNVLIVTLSLLSETSFKTVLV